jgi:hypothetical protein
MRLGWPRVSRVDRRASEAIQNAHLLAARVARRHTTKPARVVTDITAVEPRGRISSADVGLWKTNTCHREDFEEGYGLRFLASEDALRAIGDCRPRRPAFKPLPLTLDARTRALRVLRLRLVVGAVDWAQKDRFFSLGSESRANTRQGDGFFDVRLRLDLARSDRVRGSAPARC